MNSMHMYTLPFAHIMGRQGVETKDLKMKNAQMFCLEQEMHIYSTKKLRKLCLRGYDKIFKDF